MPESAPEVAIVNGVVHVRWGDTGPWSTLRCTPGGGVASGQARELPAGASRLVELGWTMRDVAVGDIYPVGGVVGDCPVLWQVYPGVDESWWVCTLPAGHEAGPAPLPHVAASYSRVDAVLPDLDARQAMLRRCPTVKLADAS